MEAQIERFAPPGFRKTILSRHIFTAATMELHNANLVGGDISGGAQSASQLFLRPSRALLSHLRKRHLHLLCVNTAGWRRPRNVRVLCGESGSRGPRCESLNWLRETPQCSWPVAKSMSGHFRHAFWLWLRTPLVSATIVVSLAVAIGAKLQLRSAFFAPYFWRLCLSPRLTGSRSYGPKIRPTTSITRASRIRTTPIGDP